MYLHAKGITPVEYEFSAKIIELLKEASIKPGSEMPHCMAHGQTFSIGADFQIRGERNAHFCSHIAHIRSSRRGRAED
jgi:hypothetical protein